MYMPVVNRSQNRVSEPLNLESPVMWVRGTELEFSEQQQCS